VNSEFSDILADVKEQILYLQELGVENLAVDLPEIAFTPIQSLPQKQIVSQERLEKFVPVDLPLPSAIKPPQRPVLSDAKPSRSSILESTKLSRLSSLPKRDSIYTAYQKPEKPTIQPIEKEMPAKKPIETPTETLFGDISQTLPIATETIEEIRADIGNCTRCPLHEGRTKIVHSKGNLQADLMFIGEAPGADEDQKGEPFVGRAGQLLTKIIEAIGMNREEVFIGNINRCRPPGNRAPTLPEAETCKPFLIREISVVRPKVIVVMGNTACQNLLNTKDGITKLRGNFQNYYGVKVMPTFHPAYLLRDPRKKREVWEDMKIVRDYLNSLK